MSITLPTNMAYEDWFNQLQIDQPTLTEVPTRPMEDNWVNDVELLLRNNQCALLNSPRPDGFANWRDWADRFIQSFGGQA